MSDNYREVYRAHMEGLRQYAYFLLAVSAAAIGFAVNQTQQARLEIWHAPLGLSVLLWGASFYFGCRNLQWVNAGLYVNATLLEVQGGLHPEARGPAEQAIAVEALRGIVEEKSNEANRSMKWAFRLLVAGAISFVLWHVGQMYARLLADTATAILL